MTSPEEMPSPKLKWSSVTIDEIDAYSRTFYVPVEIRNRISLLFWTTLRIFEQRGGVFGYGVIDELKKLDCGCESISTKKAAPFRRQPLKGLWKKHFFDARFMAENLLNEAKSDWLDQELRGFVALHEGELLSEEHVRYLSHLFVNEALDRRSNRSSMTGEWIVFAKHDGRNYYLCVASHSQKDSEIFDNIINVSKSEFPFLFEKGK